MSGPANKEVRIVSSHRDWETVSFLRYWLDKQLLWQPSVFSSTFGKIVSSSACDTELLEILLMFAQVFINQLCDLAEKRAQKNLSSLVKERTCYIPPEGISVLHSSHSLLIFTPLPHNLQQNS
jgi:hypothetical protein